MNVVYATQTAQIIMPEGYPVVVRLGTHWSADDAVVRARPDLFSEDPRHGISGRTPAESEPETETATAAPGERRSVRRG